MHSIRVMVVDDHPVFREGLKQILVSMPDFQLCGEAGSGEEALVLAPQVKPDVVIMDIRLPGQDGLECCRQLRLNHPETKVIILSVFGQRFLSQAIEAQAQACVSKELPSEELAQIIRAVYLGQLNLSQDYSGPYLGGATSKRLALSPRQQEIVRLVAAGLTNKKIAQQLHLSDTSVKREVRSIMDRLGAAKRTEAVSLAYFYNIL